MKELDGINDSGESVPLEDLPLCIQNKIYD